MFENYLLDKIGYQLNNSQLSASESVKKIVTGSQNNTYSDNLALKNISDIFKKNIISNHAFYKNTTDAISMLQTEEGYLKTAIHLMEDLRSNIIRIGNDTNNLIDKKQILSQIYSLIDQIGNVLNNGKFNDINFFDSEKQIQFKNNDVYNSNIIFNKLDTFELLGIKNNKIENAALSVSPKINSYTSKTTVNKNVIQAGGYGEVELDKYFQIYGSGIISNATIMIDNVDISNDSLVFNGYKNISGIYNSNLGLLTLSGDATAEDYETALRGIKYRYNPNSYSGDRNIKVVLGNALQGPNGHYYSPKSSYVDWTTAKKLAQSTYLYNMQGYLPTITSAAEDEFVQRISNGYNWIGLSDAYTEINQSLGNNIFASQSKSEGYFYWVTGPEKGQLVQYGNTGNPNLKQYMYTHWRSGEPSTDGNYIEMRDANSSTGPSWNDSSSLSNKYIVEFDGNLDISTSTIISVGINTNSLEFSNGSKIKPLDINSDNINSNDNYSKIDEAYDKLQDRLSYNGSLQNSLYQDLNFISSNNIINNISLGRMNDCDYGLEIKNLSKQLILSSASVILLNSAKETMGFFLKLLNNL